MCPWFGQDIFETFSHVSGVLLAKIRGIIGSIYEGIDEYLYVQIGDCHLVFFELHFVVSDFFPTSLHNSVKIL